MLNEVAEDGEAFNKSFSETIPTSFPFVTTGALRIFILYEENLMPPRQAFRVEPL